MLNWFWFVGGARGPWRVTGMRTLAGSGLASVERVNVVQSNAPADSVDASWVLHGFTSNIRYATAREIVDLNGRGNVLGRPQATCAALIPIKKSAAWWSLAQDERRAIFEETSRHTAIGLEFIPDIARRLHHCRDLGGEFDFLTWFEFAPEHAGRFDELLGLLRATREWDYVEREVEIRLERI